MEREEYTRDNYPTSGKKYNGEKAIISLTSWRARINTVDKTIYSLIKQCPGFHIVLVLSEEEFPKKEEELPERLMLFVENELIELLWVYKNYKSFKKVLFTMDKYRDVPVISADDDCIYTCNYAEELYDKWTETNYKTIYYFSKSQGTGYGALFCPNLINLNSVITAIPKVLAFNNDDVLYDAVLKKNCIKPIILNKITCIFHDEKDALSKTRNNRTIREAEVLTKHCLC